MPWKVRMRPGAPIGFGTLGNTGDAGTALVEAALAEEQQGRQQGGAGDLQDQLSALVDHRDEVGQIEALRQIERANGLDGCLPVHVLIETHGAVSPERTTRRPRRGSPSTCSGRTPCSVPKL